MRTCINGATTMPYSLEIDVEAAGRTGFEYIEIWNDPSSNSKLERYIQSHSKEELKDLISSFDLGVSAICPFGGYVWCSETEFGRKLEETRRYLEIGSHIGCESLLVCADGFDEKNRNKIIQDHADRLRRLADVSEDYDVKIALEWFWDLKDAVQVVNLANHEYLGMIIDTFHWYRGDGNMDNIDLIPSDKLFLVHINDCEDIERGKLTDMNRVYCGYGVIPLVEILRRFRRKGYGGCLSVEIFREEYWKKDASTIFKESLETLREVMKKI